METFTFKNYVYTVQEIPSKAQFDATYNELLTKANKGKSITKDLEKAYRIRGSKDIYLIRYDEVRRALVPVRAAKESVDGFLMKNRYDDKDRVIQSGIGQEMSRHTKDVYETVEKKHAMVERERARGEAESKERQALAEIDGTNFRERIAGHGKACGEIRTILAREDLQYRVDRDYRARIEQGLGRIVEEVETFAKAALEIDRAPDALAPKVRAIFPGDLDLERPPPGFLVMLEYYHYIGLCNAAVEREWITLRDYGLDLSAVPVQVKLLVEGAFLLIANTRRLSTALERLLFPEKIGAKREAGIEYSMRLLTSQVIRILVPGA